MPNKRKAVFIEGIWLGMPSERAIEQSRQVIEATRDWMASGSCFGLDRVYAERVITAAEKRIVTIQKAVSA